MVETRGLGRHRSPDQIWIAEDLWTKEATYRGACAIRFTFTIGHMSKTDFPPFLSAAERKPVNVIQDRTDRQPTTENHPPHSVPIRCQ